MFGFSAEGIFASFAIADQSFATGDCTTGGSGCVTEANLDGFVNGEAISNHDVVIWYAGHVTHDVAHDHPGEFGHICGPDLKPVNW